MYLDMLVCASTCAVNPAVHQNVGKTNSALRIGLGRGVRTCEVCTSRRTCTHTRTTPILADGKALNFMLPAAYVVGHEL